MRNHLIACAFISLLAGTTAHAQYSNAVEALSPVAYWPLSETVQPPAAYVATNSGTLGAQGNAYYNNAYYSLGSGQYNQMTLFTGPQPGATSDGDLAAGFGAGANNNDNSGYLIIPQVSKNLTVGTAFSAEVWVKPGGGDPNDSSGGSFASTEWAGLIKKGGGGAFYTENGDVNGNTYGWTISMAGINCLGYPVGWYGGTPYTGPLQLQTNATWVVDFYNGNNGNNPSMEFDVAFQEPTPQWFHLVLTYDGTNANFYTNGVLAATTVPGLPQSTNNVWAPNQAPITTPTGAYAFTPNNGVSYAADTINPICLGNLNESFSFINDGFPQANAIGFNCQTFNGSMDEAAIYTNALSASAVAQHYANATAANTTLYTNAVLSANPIVYLRFDEPAYTDPATNTFPVANNYGSMGAAGQGLYQPGVIPGIPGAPVAGFGTQSRAVQMNGLDAVVDVGLGTLNGSALDPTGNTPFSVAAWFRGNPADCYGRFQTILGRGDDGWRFSIDNSGHLHWNPGAGPEINNNKNMNDGAWHQIVGVSDGATASLYIDGQLSVSQGGVNALSGSFNDLFIGGAPDYTTSDNDQRDQRYFAGQLAQVAFFGSALTGTQIQNLYFAADLPPSITQQPQNVTIGQGNTGTLNSAATGSPTLVYQWFQGPTKLSDVAGNISGSATPALTILNAQPANAGNYTVVVTNGFGATTSAVAVVTIAAAPTITNQPSPASITLYSGNQLTYTVGAAGAPPLAYQWFRGASSIAGATGSSYTFAALGGTNTYKVVITNTHGSATSSVVTAIGQVFAPPATGGFTINYAVAPNSTASAVFNGQAAYHDPGNNNWNAVPGASGAASPLALTSASNSTLAAFTLDFGFNNGVTQTPNGTPSYLLSYEDAVNSGSPGVGNAANPTGEFIISDVPQGVYTLYIYAANFDGDRGSTFTLNAANGGVADGGTNSTVNGSVNGTHAIVNATESYAEGDNYVLFHDVVPDATGTITATYVPNLNPISGNNGEAPFNGMQLALHLISIKVSGGNATLAWTGGVLQSAPTPLGPWTTVVGTSPVTVPVTGSAQFFHVY